MNEYVVINDTKYECSTLSELHYLYFTFTDKTVDELKELFTNVTELQIVDEEDVVRGSYENLKFISVEEVVGSVSEDDNTSVPSVIVKLYIKSQLEVDVDTLKVTQDEQDEIISELVFGTEEVSRYYE